MTSPVLLLLAPLLGVTFGYEPSTDSDVGYVYTVQIEPEMVEQMERGNAGSIEVNIPPEVAPIERIRVVVGTDTLTKKLRPGAALHATYRQDLDSASIGLLAQTGPAGGYGRNSTGFSDTTRSSTVPTTTQFTVPAISTNTTATTATANDATIRSNVEAGFAAAGNTLQNTTSAVRGTLNNVGSAGQGVIDNVRTTASDLIAPPDTNTYNPQNTPLENVGNRLQAEFRDDTAAMRNSIDRMTGTNTQPTTTTQNWSNAPINNSQLNEQSVLTNPNPATANPNTAASTMSQYDELLREKQLLQQQLRDQQLLAQQQMAEQQRQAAIAAANTTLSSSNFPEQPRLQSVPDRTQPSVLDSFGDRSMLNTVSNNQFGQLPTVNANVNTTPVAANNNAADPFNTPLQSTSPQNLPSIGSAPETTTVNKQTTDNTPNPESWGNVNSTSQAGMNGAANEVAKTASNLPSGILAWAFAFGLGAVNLFQWLQLVDMRNKYRVALRRNSPNFSRSAAA